VGAPDQPERPDQAGGPDMVIDRALLLIQVNRNEEALKVLREHPDDAAARMWSAVALQSMKRLKEGLAEAERSIGMAPDVAVAHAVRSDILLDLHRNKESLEAAQEAVRLDPEQPLIMVALARAAADARKWKVAEAAAAEAIHLAPDLAEAHAVAGYVQLRRGRRKAATGHLRSARELDPVDTMVLNNLALARSVYLPSTESVTMLEAAVQIDPSNPLLVDNLYLKTSDLAHGHGFDRLDALMFSMYGVLIAIDAVIVLGWVHPPAIVTAIAFGLTLLLVIVYSVADFVRNRQRMKATANSTQQLFRRRFLWDWFVQVVYFVVTFAVPGLALAIIDSALGLSGLVQWLIAFAFIIVWTMTALPFWYKRVRYWAGSKK
jgi:tetratricopeptide (TPR) repeat protein